MKIYKPVIGLEIHVELKTSSKMFCQCEANYFGKDPNTNTCPVCLGMPGALPVPNRTAVEWTIKLGLALNCTINKHSKFDRKHYFYPDLPKGYQISQLNEPIAENGRLDVPDPKSGTVKSFRIHRVHLEEDTGKLIHAGEDTLVDFNRSSVPLVEIVTEPDFDNSVDVKAFLEELHTLIRTLDISDADMEKGSMRMEPNISLRVVQNETENSSAGFELPSYKVEVKNINSFNFAKRAIDFELIRQQKLLEEGITPPQETRGYDDKKGVTFSQRSKEDAHDYRYFSEPDIPPMEFSNEYLSEIKKTVPELPSVRLQRFQTSYGVKFADAFMITRDQSLSVFFESVMKVLHTQKSELAGQQIANLIINKKLSSDQTPDEFLRQAGELLKPKSIDSSVLAEAIQSVISAQQKVVADYKNGKTNAVMFLVGQVMREMKGQADAASIKRMLEEQLSG